MPSPASTSDPLVTPAWLAKRLHTPDLLVLDATLPPVGVSPAPDVHARFREQHLPGAVFFDIEAFSDHTSPLPHMLPTPEAFAAGMSALGARETMTFVVYEQAGVFSGPRAWWMLRTMGVQNVFVLQGGLEAWRAAGLPTTAGDPPRSTATFHAHLNPHAVASFEQLQATLASGGTVLDARSAARFAGTAPEPRPGLPSGHMPGAHSLPYTELTEGKELKSPEALTTLFATRGLDLTQPITTTCGSGITAAVLALGLARCGAARVQLYDGSWAEYAQQPGVPIETTPK